MMTQAKGRLLLSGLFFVIAVIFFADALSFERLAAQLPLMVTSLLAILAGVEVRNSWISLKKVQEKKDTEEGEKGETGDKKNLYAYFFRSSDTGIWMLFMGLIYILVFGVVYGVSLFNLTTMKLAGGKSWPVAIAISAGLYLLIYIVFIKALHIDFYKGVFALF